MSALTGISQLSSLSQTSAETSTGQTLEIPKSTTEALTFLELLDEDDFRSLMFTDQLVTVSDLGKELGEFVVTVSTTRHQGTDCLLVHANSHGAIDGVPCGTSITAHVTYTLDTLEQHHHEYIKLENHPLDRKTIVTKQESDVLVTRVITQGQDVQRTSRAFSFEEMKGFMSEGSNLLLQRLLVKKGVPENMQLIAFDSDGNICPVIYRSLEARTQVVAETELDVFGIERTISSLSDLPTTWHAYFSKDGHLTSRVQVGSPVTMRLLVPPVLEEEEEEPEKPKFGKKELNWEEDMQLYSKFLDRKEQLKSDHATYMRQHPELKALMADFLQFLLLRKPDDTIAFAAEYFSSFSRNVPNPSPYSQSATPNPFPGSRTNSSLQYLAQSR